METQSNIPTVLNTDELQSILKIGKSSVYQLLSSGRIRAIKMGRSWKIPLEAVYEYLNNNSCKTNMAP